MRKLIAFVDNIPVFGLLNRKVREKYVGMMEASERNYVTVLNVLCAETYKRMLAGIDSPSGFQKRKFAGLANLATGSGML